jgi:hypothetical protein
MKIQPALEKMVEKLLGHEKSTEYKWLEQQQQILNHGLETSAEVMDVSLENEKIGSLLPVRLWLKLKKSDGSFIYTHTQALVPLNLLPGKGQILRIKYMPENISTVLILSIISH